MKEQLKKADLFGLAIIAAALITYSTRGVWSMYQTIATVAGGLLVVTSIALKMGEIQAGLQRRSTKYGINSATTVILVLGILAFVNYLGAQHSKRVDMTSEKIFSLSDQSVQVSRQVKEEVHIKAFYKGGEYIPVRDLLRLYSHQNSKILFEFVDPDTRPEVAKQYAVTVYGNMNNPLTGQSTRFGTLILEMGTKTERIEKQGGDLKEEDITNSLLKLVKGVQKTIYFTEGHGEKSTSSTDDHGYQLAKTALQKENYLVKTLNLIQEGKVPQDASVVVMVGPTTEPLPAELDTLDAYLNGGGNALVMLDPPPSASLKGFLSKWSLDAGANFVIDNSGLGKLYGTGPTVPLVTTYEGHRITQGFDIMTFFPLARSITPEKPGANGIVVEPILRTNYASWAESDMKPGVKQFRFDEKDDIKGPVTIAAVATKTMGEKKAHLAVFGDSDFAINQFFGL
ncbi:MAG TPA: GldG family protein, partial [Terriglobia bacterium]|nr:GldG family protein [Terriglobia bacterium]